MSEQVKKIENTLTVRTYPKINLTLDVLGVLPNGYHEVEMIMQSVRLFDEVTVTLEPEHGEIRISSDKFYVPCDSRNTAYKAAQFFFEAFPQKKCGVHIYIKKNIPVAAGIAGGSCNAAGVLKALNRLTGVHAGKRRLMEIGAKVGADVPYCILGGTAVARGIGCDLTRIAPAPQMILCMAKPNFSVSTAAVYKEIDAAEVLSHPDTSGMIAAIEKGSIEEIAGKLSNVLETVTIKNHPAVQKVKDKMTECGALGCVMSGSGPTVFGIFPNYKSAYKARAELRKFVKFAEVTKTKN